MKNSPSGPKYIEDNLDLIHTRQKYELPLITTTGSSSYTSRSWRKLARLSTCTEWCQSRLSRSRSCAISS